MRVLSAQAMREVDRRAMDELGIPGPVLMENAAIGVADALGEIFPDASSVTVLCGPGNNGGDGLALTRHLDGRGYRCRTFLLLGRSGLQGDALLQRQILQRAELAVEELAQGQDWEHLLAAAAHSDLVVDALFGTGLSRPLEGRFAELVQALNDVRTPVLAVDLPSGLDASRGEPIGVFLRAEATVTFAAPKVAQVLGTASQAMGQLVVTDLGLPAGMVKAAPGNLHLSTREEVAALVRPRVAESHKGSYGHAVLVAGSEGKSGAAVLAARAAVHGGAGLVTAAVPETLIDSVDSGCVEAMAFPLALESGHLGTAAGTSVLALMEGKAALAVGPGLGQEPGTVDLVRMLCQQVALPLVLDADGLNALAGRLAEIATRSAATVLTPHPGEMARLLGTTAAAVQADRLGSVQEAARQSGSVVLLKGYRTLVASPDGEVVINPTGHPAMASGGSGDVLTGLLLALLAQGYEAFTAAQLGAWLHGRAGELGIDARGGPALPAGQLLDFLGPAWEQLLEA